MGPEASSNAKCPSPLVWSVAGPVANVGVLPAQRVQFRAPVLRNGASEVSKSALRSIRAVGLGVGAAATTTTIAMIDPRMIMTLLRS